MTNNKKLYGFIVIIFIVLAGITAFLVYFAYNITQFTTYPTKTAIGSVYVGGLFGDQAKEKVSTACDSWQDGAQIKLNYQGYEITLDANKFRCDVNRSISSIVPGQTSSLFVSIDPDDPNYITDEILKEENVQILKFSNFDFNRLRNYILQQVSLLYYDIRIDLGKYVYIKDFYEENVTEIKKVEINYSDAEFLYGRIDLLLDDITIAGSTEFSLKKYVEENQLDDTIFFSNDDLSIIATGIYQLILDTNFHNIGKEISTKVPAYTTSGLEALVTDDDDFTFYNPNPFPYYISIEYESRVVASSTHHFLVFKLHGTPFVNTIKSTVYTTTMAPKDIYWYQDTWQNEPVPITPILAYPGYPGYRSLVVRKITKPDGSTYTEILSEDIYMPKENIYIKRPVSK